MIRSSTFSARARARTRASARRKRGASRGVAARASADVVRVAVVGGGFAGVAAAFRTLEEANARGRAVELTLIDARGVGGGASGVAAGLLHPYTPRGRTIWRGEEGAARARRLLDAAARAEDAMDAMTVERCDDADGGWRDDAGRNTGERRGERVASAPGIVRPARSAKQGRDFAANARRGDDDDDDASFAVKCVTTDEVLAMCPGLEFTSDVVEAERRGEACAGGMFVPNGVVVDAPRYLTALWDACAILASRGAAGTRATLRIAEVDDVKALLDEFDQVALCCGAGVAALFDFETIPVSLQGGHVLELKPEGLRVGILGTTYVAPLGDARAMIGPTKEYDATPEDCARSGVVDDVDDERSARAISELRELGARAYPPCANWEFLRLKYGVRANPPRTPAGALPLAGSVDVDGRRCWFAAGLGARGLIYHGLLADWLSSAILDDDINAIPVDVRRTC